MPSSSSCFLFSHYCCFEYNLCGCPNINHLLVLHGTCHLHLLPEPRNLHAAWRLRERARAIVRNGTALVTAFKLQDATVWFLCTHPTSPEYKHTCSRPVDVDAAPYVFRRAASMNPGSDLRAQRPQKNTSKQTGVTFKLKKFGL